MRREVDHGHEWLRDEQSSLGVEAAGGDPATRDMAHHENAEAGRQSERAGTT